MNKGILLSPLLIVAAPLLAVADPPRGYSIPVIDLAADSERQSIVDREPGQYLGHPTTVLLDDQKTILTVYPKGHGRGAIVMKRSHDGGRSWGPREATPPSWETSKEVPTLYRITGDDPARTQRLILFSGLYPIRLAIGDPLGKTWSELEPIGDYGGIVAVSCLTRLKDGRYMALFHDDGRFFKPNGKSDRFLVYKILSDDGGLTWSEPVVIAGLPQVHLCEPGAFRSPDGRQIAVLLRENSRKQNSFVIFTDDEGETWSEPRQLPGALTGDRHQGVYGGDGRLFISFRDRTRVSQTQGDWVAWVGTYQDIVNGTEGQYRVRLMDNRKGSDCAYPGVVRLPDDTIVTTTYGHWTKDASPYIVSVRLKLSELDELAKTRGGQ